jgi:hypothetical protein
MTTCYFRSIISNKVTTRGTEILVNRYSIFMVCTRLLHRLTIWIWNFLMYNQKPAVLSRAPFSKVHYSCCQSITHILPIWELIKNVYCLVARNMAVTWVGLEPTIPCSRDRFVHEDCQLNCYTYAQCSDHSSGGHVVDDSNAFDDIKENDNASIVSHVLSKTSHDQIKE